LRVQKATELAALLEPPAPEEKTADFDTRELMPATAPAEEDTQILPPKWPSADETQILPSKSLPGDNTQILPSTQLSGDDTQILPSKPPSADDTFILPSRRPSADDTQILPSTPPRGDDTQILPVPVGSPPAKEAPLTLFNRYEYHPNISLIGKGGFSRVYKAFDRRLDRWVALKIYKGNEFLERYSPIAEIRRVVNLDHPNICRYLDIEEIEKENGFGEKETTQICVMELLDGGNFAQYYAAHPEEMVMKKLLADVLTGLAYLHKNGMIHRDIKPANILIKETMDGPVAKITDFGISKLSNSINSNSSSALIVSIPYMAPEQLNAKKYGINENISFNLDLWSLGVTIYEVITNDILFRNNEQDSSEQIMTNIMAPELPAKVRELPQPFRDIVSHCIVKDARNRAQRAEELIAMLHRNSDEKPAMPPPPTMPPPPQSPAAEPVQKPKKFSFLETPKEGTTIVKEELSPPPSKPRPERLIRNLTIAIAAAAAIFCIVLYFYLDTKKKEQLLLLPGKKPDSVSIVSSVPVQNETPKPKPTPQDSFVVPPVEKVDNKPRESTNPPLRRVVETTHPGNQKYVLRLTANENCKVKVGPEDYYDLNKDQELKIRLSPGQYAIQATGIDNPKLTYLGSLAVTEKDMGRTVRYKILLHP
jgi:serine/threonine protein kinase